MAISNRNPAANRLIPRNQTISFDIDDTYTSMLIEAVLDSGTEVVYDGGLGGAQPGYNVSVADDGVGTHTFSFSRNSGWSGSTVKVQVTEDESGVSTVTSTTYELVGTAIFPEFMEPRNDESVGTLIVSDTGVAVRTDVGEINLVGFSVTDLGGGKVEITDTGGGGGGLALGAYTFDTSTVMADPGTGDVRFDSATPSAVTQIAVSTTNENGLSELEQLRSLNSGDRLYIERQGVGSTQSQQYLIEDVVDAGTHVLFTVVYIDGLGTLYADGNNIVVRGIPASTRFGGLGVWRFGGSGGGVPSSGEFTSDGATLGVTTSYKIDGEPLKNVVAGGVEDLLDEITPGSYIVMRNVENPDDIIAFSVSANNANSGYVELVPANKPLGFGSGPSGTELWEIEVWGWSDEVLTGTSSPSASAGDNRPVGTLFVDTTNLAVYALIDNTTGANVWSNPLSANNAGSGVWLYAGDADTTPASGKFSFDTSAIGIATNLYVHDTQDSTGLDLGSILGDLETGDYVYIGSLDDGAVGSWHKVNGTPTETTSVWDIPLDGAGDSSVTSYALDERCYILPLFRAQAAGAGSDFRAGYGEWLYDSSSTAGAGIGAGDFRLNNANPSSATKLYIADTNSEGRTIATLGGKIFAGDIIVINNDGGTESLFATVSVATNQTGYWEYDISVDNADASFTNNGSFNIVHIPADKALSGSGAPGVSTGNGYEIGTPYLDTTANEAYFLVDNTFGSNVWSSATGSGGGGGSGNDAAIGEWSKGADTIGLTAADSFDTDNATIASITQLRFLGTNPLTPASTNMVDILENLPQTGWLLLHDISDPKTNQVIFRVTSHSVNSSTYWDVNVDNTFTREEGTNWATSYSLQFVPDVTPVEGPASTTVNRLVKWNSTDGTLVAEEPDIFTNAGKLFMADAGGTGSPSIRFQGVGSAPSAVAGQLWMWAEGSGNTLQLWLGSGTANKNVLEETKAISIENPSTSEDRVLFYTEHAITVQEMNAVIRGTATPDVTWTVRHSTDRSAAGNEVVTGGTTTSSTTTGDSVTTFNDETIPAGSWVWLETTASTGSVDELAVSVRYWKD